jgi:hypothetical protein
MDLKFPRPSFRVGTIKDSIYSIMSTIEYLEQDGRIQYKELGPSPDGKVTNEFHIFPTNGMAPFAIYDYKFGFDPSDEDNYEEEFEFSIGGASKDAEESARKLGFEVVSKSMEEAYHVGDDKEVITKEAQVNMLTHIMMSLEKLKKSLDPVEMSNYEAYEASVMRDVLSGDKNRSNQYKEEDFDWKEDYDNYIMDKTDLDEIFVRQMKYRAGIIK